MTDLLTRLLDAYAKTPDHLGSGPLRTCSQAYEEDIPLTPEQESIQSQLDSLDALLDTPAPPTLSDLVANTPPAKLAKAVADATQTQAQAQWLKREAGALRAALYHARIAANAQPEVFDVAREYLSQQINDNVTGLLIAAKELGPALLGDSATLLERDSVMVQRVKTSIVQLTSLTRVRIAGAQPGDSLRTVALFAALEADEAEGGDQGTLALAAAAAKKGTGVLLAGLSLGLIPGLRLTVAESWETVLERRKGLDDLRKELAKDQPTATVADHRLSLDSSGVSNF